MDLNNGDKQADKGINELMDGQTTNWIDRTYADCFSVDCFSVDCFSDACVEENFDIESAFDELKATSTQQVMMVFFGLDWFIQGMYSVLVPGKTRF